MMQTKNSSLKKEKLFSCSVCRKSYRRKDKRFTPSCSPIYKGNDGFMTICRDCILKIYEQYLEKFGGNEYSAIKRMCMLLNICFCDKLFEYSGKNNKCVNRMSSYLSKINLISYMSKTFDDYLFSPDYEEPKIEQERPSTIPERLIKTWGFGFTFEEYQFLNNKFSEWKAKVVIDGMARESLVRDLCIIKLQQQKALQNSEIDLWGKLQKTFQDTLTSANLKPIQTENDAKAMEKPFKFIVRNSKSVKSRSTRV